MIFHWKLKLLHGSIKINFVCLFKFIKYNNFTCYIYRRYSLTLIFMFYRNMHMLNSQNEYVNILCSTKLYSLQFTYFEVRYSGRWLWVKNLKRVGTVFGGLLCNILFFSKELDMQSVCLFGEWLSDVHENRIGFVV
jgi:hypothetical protein